MIVIRVTEQQWDTIMMNDAARWTPGPDDELTCYRWSYWIDAYPREVFYKFFPPLRG